MSQKIIYLDQHGWINLAQAYFGKNKDMYTLCEKVIKSFRIRMCHLLSLFIWEWFGGNKERY